MAGMVLVQKKFTPRAFVDLTEHKQPSNQDRQRGISKTLHAPMLAFLIAFLVSATQAVATNADKLPIVPKRERFEQQFRSSTSYKHPLQQAALMVEFVSPLGETNLVPGFWDGGRTWRVRFAPNQLGRWTYKTSCSDSKNKGLSNQTGEFLCTVGNSTNRFRLHGPIRLTSDRRRFEHADGTPFSWLADTVWQGAQQATPQAWQTYAAIRAGQNFSAAQWIAVPAAMGRKQPAFSGREQIAINPEYFRQLDAKVDALNEAGLLDVIAPFWEIGASSADTLPEDQAALLLRYLAARWGASHVAWLLAFDGGSVPQNIGRWKRIGRAAFEGTPHAPVILFPGETTWVFDDYRNETWVDVFGFGVNRSFDDDSIKWLVSGPLTAEWRKNPTRPLLLVSPLLENSVASHGRRVSADDVRRTTWWSLLLAPPAGTCYGAEAVANWDSSIEKQKKDDRASASAADNLPLWYKSLFLPGAKETALMADFLSSVDLTSLVPAARTVAIQPGSESPQRTISAAASEGKDFLLAYVPEERKVILQISALPRSPVATWINPRTDETHLGVALVVGKSCEFPTPAPGDWLLAIRAGK